MRSVAASAVRAGSAGAILLLLAGPAIADVITFNFWEGAAGDLGTASIVVTSSGVSMNVDGAFYNGESWTDAGLHLYRRNEPNDHGLGVCNPNEQPCPGPLGGGDINELDNEGNAELIRLTLPEGFEWVSVGVSSLDKNDKTNPGLWERGRLWADLDGEPSSLDTIIQQFAGGGPIEPDFLIGAAYKSSPYLFFEPFDWTTGGANDNNDFLVRTAAIERTAPEPATVVLIGTGLLGLALGRRRRS